ncbi:hypothetical protein FOMPIDRAFT_1057627 [Fomitopsis schrenkii]|uniref:Uncharacterized protein n=1 Tax=Fomitopsis schrenkii TaxID=2126942 RepID=S8EMJ3_FOMSC|nr:hypothetical protein FOMPIDRAFT_1057627 [Fomitopsis schrenkii]
MSLWFRRHGPKQAQSHSGTHISLLRMSNPLSREPITESLRGPTYLLELGHQRDRFEQLRELLRFGAPHTSASPGTDWCSFLPQMQRIISIARPVRRGAQIYTCPLFTPPFLLHCGMGDLDGVLYRRYFAATETDGDDKSIFPHATAKAPYA